MARSHAECDHPKTRDARIACRAGAFNEKSWADMTDAERGQAIASNCAGYMREYNARPEQKAARAEYRARPEVKAAEAKRAGTARRKAAKAKYAASPAGRSKLRARKIKRQRLKDGADCESVDLRVVFDCDGGICHLCDYPVEWLAPGESGYHTWGPSSDHVIPLQGEDEQGHHTYLNVRLAHRSCNSSKGNRPWTPAKRKAARVRYRRDHPKAA